MSGSIHRMSGTDKGMNGKLRSKLSGDNPDVMSNYLHEIAIPDII